jgi:hypothetical protein
MLLQHSRKVLAINSHKNTNEIKSFDNFIFSFSQAADVKKSIENDFETISNRVTAIVDSEKFYIEGFPVLKNILMLDPSKEDLKKLSKALDRLADLLAVYREISSKLSLITTMQENQTWFTNSFANFDKEIEYEFESLFKESE